LKLDLFIQARCGKRIVPYLRRHLPAAYQTLRRGPLELSLALVGDQEMKRLHQRYLKINHPTDVLSFELEHGPRGRVTAGEVIVCVPQARRQAKGELKEEVLLLALHGMLHLCGMDDKTQRGFAAMHRAEDRILSRLGVGRIFGTGA
jgi:probable rRNA maturation factor